jgi:hypothetical protein
MYLKREEEKKEEEKRLKDKTNLEQTNAADPPPKVHNVALEKAFIQLGKHKQAWSARPRVGYTIFAS